MLEHESQDQSASIGKFSFTEAGKLRKICFPGKADFLCFYDSLSFSGEQCHRIWFITVVFANESNISLPFSNQTKMFFFKIALCLRTNLKYCHLPDTIRLSTGVTFSAYHKCCCSLVTQMCEHVHTWICRYAHLHLLCLHFLIWNFCTFNQSWWWGPNVAVPLEYVAA